MTFLHPFWLLLFLLLPIPWLLYKKREYLIFSHANLLDALKPKRLAIMKHITRLPTYFTFAAIGALIIALADPAVRGERGTKVVRSRDIIIAVDISTSMTWPFEGNVEAIPEDIPEFAKAVPQIAKPRKRKVVVLPGDVPALNGKPAKIEAAKNSVLRFVRHRYQRKAGDRVGVMVFDEWPRWCWPLTIDLKQAYRNGQFLDTEMGGGTNFGREMPGPIDAAVEHFEALGQAETKVIIMVTDGIDQIPFHAMDRLEKAIKRLGIRMYVIGIGDEISPDLQSLVMSVRGQVFHVESTESLEECFTSIDALEQTPVTIEVFGEPQTVFYVFSCLSMCFLAGAVVTRFFVLDF